MNLALKHLTVCYGTRPVIDDFSLTVPSGRLFALLGPSGCGKSTLLKTVAGLISPQQGRIFLGTEDVTDLPPHRRGVPMMFQDMRLFPHLTALENVAYRLRMAGVGKKERLAQAAALLETVHLADRAEAKPSELSGGQQQRVTLARALAGNPPVLLLDEPFSDLDRELKRDMHRLLREIHRRRTTTLVLVTHDPEEALLLADEMAVMHRGKPEQIGRPEELCTAPATDRVASYFTDNHPLPGLHRQGHFFGCGLSLPACGTEGPVVTRLDAAKLFWRSSEGPWQVVDCSFSGRGYRVEARQGTHRLIGYSPRKHETGSRGEFEPHKDLIARCTPPPEK